MGFQKRASRNRGLQQLQPLFTLAFSNECRARLSLKRLPSTNSLIEGKTEASLAEFLINVMRQHPRA
jgi:hypothetical protein